MEKYPSLNCDQSQNENVVSNYSKKEEDNLVMPKHIQQMLFDFALERGYIEMILKEKGEL